MRNIIYVVILSLVISCHQESLLSNKERDKYKIKYIEWEDFSVSKQLESKDFPYYKALMPRDILVVGDFLVIAESKRDTVFHKVKIGNEEIHSQFGIKGVGPGEIESVWTMALDSDSTFWAFSISTKISAKYNINKDSFKSEIDLRQKSDEFYLAVDILPINDSIFITRRTTGEDKFVLFDHKGNIIDTIDKWSDLIPDPNIPVNVKSSIFLGFCSNNPIKKNMFINASARVDMIEIVNIENKSTLSVRGPVNFFPEVEVDYSAGYPMYVSKDSERLMYMDSFLGENKIYTLFSGHLHIDVTDKSKPIYCENILVFDLEGNPLVHYELDTSLRRFTVDEKNNKIYGVTIDYDIVEFAL